MILKNDYNMYVHCTGEKNKPITAKERQNRHFDAAFRTIFRISVFKEASRNCVIIFLLQTQPKNFKTICACIIEY